MTWREYHESTKHSVESLKRAQYVLDWANMPDPFRHYEGVPVLDLPADPQAPEFPALELLQGASGTTPAADGPTFLSQLLFYSTAISASKRVSVFRPHLLESDFGPVSLVRSAFFITSPVSARICGHEPCR
jgi:hypothetical protein